MNILRSKAEHALYQASRAIEELPADVALTEAVVHVSQASLKVAAWLDANPAYASPKPECDGSGIVRWATEPRDAIHTCPGCPRCQPKPDEASEGVALEIVRQLIFNAENDPDMRVEPGEVQALKDVLAAACSYFNFHRKP